MQSSHLKSILLFLSLQTVHIKVPRILYPPHWKSGQRLPKSPRSLGEQIRQHRLELHWLQADLAKAIGVHVVSISNWERETSNPSRTIRKRIQEFLDYTPRPVPKSMTAGLCAGKCERHETNGQVCLFEKVCTQLDHSDFQTRFYATDAPKMRAPCCLLVNP